MSSSPQNVSSRVMLNRPVHLARRDVFYEAACERLNRPMKGMAPQERLEQVQGALEALKTADRHARLAGIAEQVSEAERDFLGFLSLMARQIRSMAAMLEHQIELAQEQSLLCRFLGATPEEAALPAQHYQRRADDIFDGFWHLMQRAHGSYARLRQQTLETLAPEDRARYERALESFREEVAGAAG